MIQLRGEVEKLSEQTTHLTITVSDLERLFAHMEHIFSEMADVKQRISALEQQIQGGPGYLSPAGSLTEKRALQLLQYVEKHGRVNTRQAKKILNCNHHMMVHRAMDLVSIKFSEEVILEKTRTGMTVLISRNALHSLHRGVQGNLCR